MHKNYNFLPRILMSTFLSNWLDFGEASIRGRTFMV